MIAARNGGDPDMNPRLRLVVEQAKKASMPRETLERAIKKGAGLLEEGTSLERLTYDGFAPHRVPVIVEFGVKRRSASWLAHWGSPLLGIAVVLMVLWGMSALALVVGLAWLAAGILWGLVLRARGRDALTVRI